jgi:thiosulfate dehydrogenase [quinone] large subunit
MSSDNNSTLGQVFATLLLRLWLGVRALQTGIEKFAGKVMSEQPVEVDGEAYDPDLTEVASTKGYSFDNYNGIPESMKDTFKGEPLMMNWALNLFDKVLGPLLILLGITILLGVANRVSLFILGLIYVGLTWGLILIKQDAGIAWLGVHIVMVAMALNWANHNRLCILKKW